MTSTAEAAAPDMLMLFASADWRDGQPQAIINARLNAGARALLAYLLVLHRLRDGFGGIAVPQLAKALDLSEGAIATYACQVRRALVDAFKYHSFMDSNPLPIQEGVARLDLRDASCGCPPPRHACGEAGPVGAISDVCWLALGRERLAPDAIASALPHLFDRPGPAPMFYDGGEEAPWLAEARALILERFGDLLPQPAPTAAPQLKPAPADGWVVALIERDYTQNGWKWLLVRHLQTNPRLIVSTRRPRIVPGDDRPLTVLNLNMMVEENARSGEVRLAVGVEGGHPITPIRPIVLPGGVYDSGHPGLLQLVKEVTAALAQAAHAALETTHGPTIITNPEALAALIEGVGCADIGGEPNMRRAIAAFERAIAADPNFWYAHVELARVYGSLGRLYGVADWEALLKQSAHHARKARKLTDPIFEQLSNFDLAVVQLAEGYGHFGLFRKNIAAAALHYDEAIACSNGALITALYLRANCWLDMRGLETDEAERARCLEEAEALVRQAMERSADRIVSLQCNSVMAKLHLMKGEYETAAHYINRATAYGFVPEVVSVAKAIMYALAADSLGEEGAELLAEAQELAAELREGENAVPVERIFNLLAPTLAPELTAKLIAAAGRLGLAVR